MKIKLKALALTCMIAVAAPAMAATYLVMPQDGGTSMRAGLNKESGNEGSLPEMPGDNPPISIVLAAGALPDTSLDQNYSFTIPSSWVTVSGDDNFDGSGVSYSLVPINSGDTFSFSENKLSGKITEKNSYSFNLTATYKNNVSNSVVLTLNADDWHMDERGVVFCLGAPQGETKTLNGITYISAGTDKVFAAENYGSACTSNVVDMSSAPWPNKAIFNGDISHWDTSNVRNMNHMFYYASAFNQPVSNFDTSQVTSMSSMFYYASAFNQPVSNFNTSQVTSMAAMFSNASAFNQSLSNFDTSKVMNMGNMFRRAIAFNQSLSNFDTSQVTTMSYMFDGASAFNDDLSGWCVQKITSKPNNFDVITSSWIKANRQPIWGTCPSP